MAPFMLGTPIPLLEEIDDDYCDATWPSWHDSDHSMGDWASTNDEIRLYVE